MHLTMQRGCCAAMNRLAQDLFFLKKIMNL
jgi:hypothetical protein